MMDRRTTLGLLGGSLLPISLPLPALANVPTDRVTVLYRRESERAPTRLDPTVQMATLALEDEFLKRRFRVLQPSAEVYRLLDQGQQLIITFAEDAGFSMVFSAYRDLRPTPGQEAGIAEVRLSARVFVGRHILVAEEGRGQMFTRLEPAVREFGERRAMEVAARKAAADLADKTERRLRALTAAELAQLIGSTPTSTTQGTDVGLPSGPAGGGMVGIPEAPPAFPGAGLPLAPPSFSPAPAPALPPAPVMPPAPHPAPSLSPSPAPAAVPQPPPDLQSAAASLGRPKNRHALVIGMSSYESVRRQGVQIGDLAGVKRDVDFVVDSLRGLGYQGERLRVLRDAEATSGALRGELKRLRASVGPDDQLVLFISGHGGDREFSASGFGTPLLADYKPNDPGLLDFWELQSLVKNLPCRVAWINDTCHSGGATESVQSVVVSSRGVGLQGTVRGPDAGTVARSAAPGQDFAIITAAAAHELSWEQGDGGVFTTTFFKALRASKGEMPIGQLFAEQVQREVVERSKKICKETRQCQQQTPLFAYGGRGHALRL
jgi:hypothetical protein